MESTEGRVGRPRRSIGLILAIAIAVNGCATGAIGVQQSGLDRLRDQPEVLAVHYQPPPRFFVVQPRSVGRAMAGAAVLAPFALLLFGPLAPVVAPSMGNALQAEIERTEAEAAGEQLTGEIPLEDPIVRVKDGLISWLSAEGGIGRIRPAATPLDSDDLKSLKQALGPVTVLDMRTTNWGLYPHSVDPKTYLVLYSVKARLIRLDQDKVLWRAEVGCLFTGDRRFGLPTLDELRADGGSLLKTLIAGSADNCAGSLLARFRGEKPTPPAPSPDDPKTVAIDPATLELADAHLFGSSGLVEGSRRFKAKFQGLTLSTQDLPRLRATMKQATASPWRSEVQFRGTIDGVAFKAEMEKGSVGRSEFTFEGLQFDDEEQASAFLAPLQGRGVREVKLVGIAGDRPIKIILTPSLASTAPEPSSPPVAAKVDEADSTRRLVEEPPPGPSSETTVRPAPAPSRPVAVAGALKWPPAGSSYILVERKSGSYGSGRRQKTVRYLGEQPWQGRKAFAFSDGSVTSYVDAQRRILARVRDSDGAPLEAFEPYFVQGVWPLVVGKWWTNRYRHYDYRSGRRFDDVDYPGKVEAYEDVRTPAGTFKAFRIVLGGVSSHTVLWYSGDLGLVIKMQSERRSNHYLGRGVYESELVSYDFKP